MHASEMDLQTLADGEPLGAHEAEVLAHLRSCSECQRAVAEMRAAHDRDRELLRRIDHRLPAVNVDAVIARASARKSVRGLRGAIAAGIGVLAVTAAAAAAVPGSPVRAYVERIFAHATASTATTAPSATQQTPAAPREALAVGVSFPPSSRVEIVFAHPQGTGRVRITMVDTPMVRVISHGGTAAYQLTRNGVTIDSVGSDASFDVMLPSTVARATVRVGGRAVFTRYGTRIHAAGTQDSTGAYVISLYPTR